MNVSNTIITRQAEDPFAEGGDKTTTIGTVSLSLKSLGYLVSNPPSPLLPSKLGADRNDNSITEPKPNRNTTLLTETEPNRTETEIYGQLESS